MSKNDNSNNNFRDYTQDLPEVIECYKDQRKNQTLEYHNYTIKKYCKFKNKSSFWDLFDKLSIFVDLSDPDTNLTNHQHLFQTAEAIRKDGLPEWLQFVGLIHDLAK